MVKKPIEYYTIAREHWVFETQTAIVLEEDTFNSFEEARSHIYDKNEDGSYKYHGAYTMKMFMPGTRLTTLSQGRTI